jgi:RHS repeat-associated protein
MPGRSGGNYRYGFNGKEKADEVAPGITDFGERMADTDIGRFFSIDRFASKYPQHTPYGVAGNSPLSVIDVNGDSIYFVNANGKIFKLGNSRNLSMEERLGVKHLLRIKRGEKLLADWANSSSHDVYIAISSASGLTFGDGVAITHRDAHEDYLDVATGELDFGSYRAENDNYSNMYIFQGMKPVNPGRAFSLIVFNPDFVSGESSYNVAEAVYHEIYAHLELHFGLKIFGGKAQHDKYGSKYAGIDDPTKTGEAALISSELRALRAKDQFAEKTLDKKSRVFQDKTRNAIDQSTDKLLPEKPKFNLDGWLKKGN